MAKLTYTAITSLDGYLEDESGGFDWAAPDDEVHAHVNDATRAVGTYLLGRRMYEVMAVWERPDDFAGDSAVMREFAAVWQAAEKVVYSRTLDRVASERTRIERDFDPAAVRALVGAATAEVSVAGAELAAVALRAGLVDECSFYLNPVSVGGGKPALPRGLRLDLELREERRFGGGVVLLRYRVRR